MKAALMVLALALAGCSAMPQHELTPEQLKAAAADKSAAATCSVGVGPWGTARLVYVQLDKGTIPQGEVTVDQDCKVSFRAVKPKD